MQPRDWCALTDSIYSEKANRSEEESDERQAAEVKVRRCPMAWFVECPFCHKSIFRWFYSWHESGHTQRCPDGQMNEHVTLAPEKRF